MDPGAALVTQCLKALHQCALDDGNWQLAWELSSLRDPLKKPKFGGSERELAAIAAHSKAITELEDRMRKARKREEQTPTREEDAEDGGAADGSGGGAGGKGGGKRRGGRGQPA